MAATGMPRILLANTYAHTGGAARAALRLHAGLRTAGVDVTFLNREAGDVPGLVCTEGRFSGWCRGCFDILPCKLYPRRRLHNFTPAWVADGLGPWLRRLNPDILHLHWVGDGFLQPATLAGFPGPVIWTLHDSWAFTGGCYLPGECHRFEQTCGSCPVLGSQRDNDLSRFTWQSRRRDYPVDRMIFVAPSGWMASRAQSSSLLRGCQVEIIPNGIDVLRYTPGDKSAACALLDLPRGKKIILFGAKNALSDPNKGVDLAWEVLGRLPAGVRRGAVLVLFGEDTGQLPVGVDLEVVNLGSIVDEARLIGLYRAADLFLVTSRQENLPNTILEAMACGLPCAAFGVGGIPEQIAHRQTGVLAVPYDTASLATEMTWILEGGDLQKALAGQARERAVAGFALDLIAQRHLSLYLRRLGFDSGKAGH
jgi:glycosyltransferase involved in cell wall biosynthesis